MFTYLTDAIRLHSVLALQKKAIKTHRAGQFDESYLHLKEMESITEKIRGELRKVDALIAIATLYQVIGVPERAMKIMHDLANYPCASQPEIRIVSCVIVAQCAAMKETEFSEGYQNLNDTLCLSVDEDPEFRDERFNGKKAELFGAFSMGHVLRGDNEQGDILLRLALHYDPAYRQRQLAWPPLLNDQAFSKWTDFLKAFEAVPGTEAASVHRAEARRDPGLRQEPA